MKNIFRALGVGALLACIVAPAAASGTAATAKTLLTEASAKAKKEHKNVLVIFHASWCGWCKKLDAMLESPQYKTVFEKSFVITHVDVLENPTKKELENDGGVDLMTQLGGKDAGLPFMAVLSPTGTKIGDSIMPNKQNTGFPSEPQEVTYFMTLLQKTAPQMSADDRTKVEAYLRAPEPSTHS